MVHSNKNKGITCLCCLLVLVVLVVLVVLAVLPVLVLLVVLLVVLAVLLALVPLVVLLVVLLVLHVVLAAPGTTGPALPKNEFLNPGDSRETPGPPPVDPGPPPTSRSRIRAIKQPLDGHPYQTGTHGRRIQTSSNQWETSFKQSKQPSMDP